MTYQDEAKQKAREEWVITGVLNDEQIKENFDPEYLDTLVSTILTDLLDELQEEMGEEKEIIQEDDGMLRSSNPQMSVSAVNAHNALHQKLTKKFNQIRE